MTTFQFVLTLVLSVWLAVAIFLRYLLPCWPDPFEKPTQLSWFQALMWPVSVLMFLFLELVYYRWWKPAGDIAESSWAVASLILQAKLIDRQHAGPKSVDDFVRDWKALLPAEGELSIWQRLRLARRFYLFNANLEKINPHDEAMVNYIRLHLDELGVPKRKDQLSQEEFYHLHYCGD